MVLLREIMAKVAEEGDRSEFEHTGLKCLVKRVNDSGHLCGYVILPVGHSLHGKQYTDVMPELTTLNRVKELPVGENPPFQIIFSALCGAVLQPRLDLILQVHWGVTYAGTADYLGFHDQWAIGFDCAHSGDLAFFMGPERFMATRRMDAEESLSCGSNVYRDLEFVTNELKRLAEQITSITESIAQ